MCRSTEYCRRAGGRAVLAGGVAAVLVLANPGGPAAAQSDDPVAVVQDLVFIVESIDGTESTIREDTEVTVTLTSDVLFDFDEDVVTDQAQERLAGVAEQIRTDGAGGAITIAGHTDSEGTDSYNQDLSQRRADAVRDVLADLLSDEPVTFETEGYGESQPRVPNDSEQNRAQNRRVEITYQIVE